ncbi:hypothetical protein TeGR_g14709 [Tetraparma gracilis]|uniref:Uncharacterized protein n=1 Tax=Tetraparma gracilis TaxID=2962635 RepID=A0ABQ6MYN9_9STRA|nr:hypothetical protein TeGR_g14709 [Tetraparma gracilis]
MAASRQAELHAEDYAGPADHGPRDGDGDGDVAGDREAPHDEKIAAADESVGAPPRSVQEQLSQALAELLARAAELRSKDAEVALLKADADALRAEVGELRAKAAEAEEQRVEADELRLVRTKLEESENDLLRLRTETEQVDGKITLEAADFGCTKLLIAASVLLTSGVDRVVASLHDRFARYKEVDEATLRHFVEHGKNAAPESSEKEKDFGLGAEKQIVDTALEAEKRSVLGRLRGFYRIKTLSPNVCRVTFVLQGNLGGSFTKQAMAWALKHSLGMVKSLQDKYMRNGAKVDAEIRGAFPAPPLRRSLTSEQDALVARCLTLEKGAEGSNVVAAVGINSAAAQARAVKGSWVELKSISPFVSMSMAYTEPEGNESSIALGKAKATLDCSAKEAFAYQFASCGREKTRISREVGDRARFVSKEHTAHDFEWVLVKKMSFPLTNREFLNRFLSFKEQTGDLVIAFGALPDSTKIDYGADLKVVRGKGMGVYRFKPINNDAQCEVAFVQNLDAGGFVPERVTVAKIPQALRAVNDMQELFQRDDAIDGAKTSELASIINTSEQPYLSDEDKLIDEVGARFASLPAFKKLDSPDCFVHMSSAFKEGSSTMIGRATTLDFGGVIPKRVQNRQGVGQLMYLSKMRKRFDRSLELDGKKRGELVKRIRRHGRDGVEYSEEEEKIVAEGKTWFKAPEEVLPYVWDTKSRDKTRPDDLEKEIDEQPNDHNQLVFNKKQTPAAIANRDFLGRMVWKEAEGVTYPDEKNKKTPSKAVAHIVKLHKGLSQLSREYPWIVAFLEEVLLGGLHRNKAVSTKLDSLSEAEARKIGKNLPGALRARKQASGGVYQWKNQNPSMVELFEKYPWVEEMVLTMGEELLKNAAWGLWFRVITGSVGSMVDLATDINVILVYFGEEGQEGYGWMMLGMVLANMGLQLGLVLLQNGKMGWGKLLREVLITVSGLKPGVDAMRVVSNAEMHEHHVLDAKMELAFTKCAEMFCESIPGCILQVTALIQGGSGGQMGTKVLSIIVSAITTGMGSAAISYDFDSDPEKRRKLPSFYGYLPDEGNARTIMYVCMVVNSALLLLLRSIGAALLMLADTKIFVAYMAGDHLLYLLQKLPPPKSEVPLRLGYAATMEWLAKV